MTKSSDHYQISENVRDLEIWRFWAWSSIALRTVFIKPISCFGFLTSWDTPVLARAITLFDKSPSGPLICAALLAQPWSCGSVVGLVGESVGGLGGPDVAQRRHPPRAPRHDHPTGGSGLPGRGGLRGLSRRAVPRMDHRLVCWDRQSRWGGHHRGGGKPSLEPKTESNVNPCSPVLCAKGYSWAMVRQMEEACRGLRHPVTFPVRAALLAQSFDQMKWLLQQSDRYHLHSQPGARVRMSPLDAFFGDHTGKREWWSAV